IRIAFDDDHQTRKRRAQLSLCGLPLLERLRILDELGRGLDRGCSRSGLHDTIENVLLGRDRTLDRIDEVRHEVRPALILVQDLGPGRFHLLVLLLQRVIAAATEEGTARQYRENTQRVHGRSLQLGSFVWRRPYRCMRKATVELTRRGQSSAYGGAPHLGSAPQV